MDELAKELTVELIPDGIYRDIAEAIGTENLYRLTKLVGGATIYLPKPESIIRPVRDARIREEFNGYNHLDLSRKYGVTERWVKKLCGEGDMEGQIDLFQFLEEAGGTAGMDSGQKGE